MENSEISSEAYLYSIGTMSFHYDDEDSDLPTIKRIVLPASLDLSSFMPKKSRGKVDEQPSVNSSKMEQPSLPKGIEGTTKKIGFRLEQIRLGLLFLGSQLDKLF